MFHTNLTESIMFHNTELTDADLDTVTAGAEAIVVMIPLITALIRLFTGPRRATTTQTPTPRRVTTTTLQRPQRG